MKKTPATKKTATKPKAESKPEPKPKAAAKKAAAPAKAKVTFKFKPEGEVGEAAVAGTFSDWQPLAMKAGKKGVWEKSIQLAAGSYEYRFIINGNWIPDPACAECVSTPFGGVNSVLTVS